MNYKSIFTTSRVLLKGSTSTSTVVTWEWRSWRAMKKILVTVGHLNWNCQFTNVEKILLAFWFISFQYPKCIYVLITRHAHLVKLSEIYAMLSCALWFAWPLSLWVEMAFFNWAALSHGQLTKSQQLHTIWNFLNYLCINEIQHSFSFLFQSCLCQMKMCCLFIPMQ